MSIGGDLHRRPKVEVGDVITSFKVFRTKTNRVVRIKVPHVVEEVRFRQDGFGHGAHDRYAGGWDVMARRLSPSGRYDPNGKLERVSHQSDERGTNEKFEIVRKLRRVVTFVE